MTIKLSWRERERERERGREREREREVITILSPIKTQLLPSGPQL
jgi:hypothetical protein